MLCCMRMTIRLDEELLAEVKALAARTNRTMTAVIEDALRQMLAQQSGGMIREPVSLYVVDGDGLQPGVDLDDSAAVIELMDDGDNID